MHTKNDKDVTFWLLLEERKGLRSLVGESRVSRLLSCTNSGLQQQVGLHSKTAQLVTPYIIQERLTWLTQKSCSREENKASPRLIPTCESIHTVNKEVRAFQKRLHKQTRWLKSKKSAICSGCAAAPRTCFVHNASPNLRLTVSLLTCHMPQKWNFSF